MNSKNYKIGIDEVGRGPIAGPVCVCSFLAKDNQFLFSCTDNDFIKENKLPKLKDSKKLSKRQREKWFEFLKNEKDKNLCDFAISFVSSENIDKFGISKCIQKALNKSLEIITQNINKITSPKFKNSRVFTPEGSYAEENSQFFAMYKIFLDGGLKAPKEFINQETIIKGDELCPVISLASIIAKVSRDKVMENFAKKYPGYGFEKHVGYGTKAHYEAIKKYGLTKIHRKTFLS